MTDIPVIFSAPMVLALLREVAEPGTGKTMTRRLAWGARMPTHVSMICPGEFTTAFQQKASPWQKVKPGDRLWVRESLAWGGNWRYSATTDQRSKVLVDRDGDLPDINKRRNVPSIHMPRWASRLTLVVTETKVESLHKINRADVLAEGVPPAEIKKWEQWLHPEDCPGMAFGTLWDSIHGKGEWDKNPEVVALRFSVHKVNIDVMKVAA